MATPALVPEGSLLDQKLKKSSPGMAGTLIFIAMLLGGSVYIWLQLSSDLSIVHSASIFPYILLGVALMIALAFEFVNGFHDAANAVATVIYTHSLEPHIAVVYSGVMNVIGVLLSTGTVAYSVITLLPVELILKVSSGSGFAMVFALLVAAILWNLATWWRGLPASSSHTMIGSIIGVGVANQLMQGNPGTSGVEWEQVTKVFKALLFSPLIGFGAPSSYSCSSGSSLAIPASTPRRKAPNRHRSTSASCSSSRAAEFPTPMARTTGKRAWASSC